MAIPAHILVVDDFAAMRAIVRNLLRDIGHHDIAEADDGTSALDALRAGRFDLLITGWNMPVMDGITLLREIRADARLASLPVLMVTAEARRERILEAVAEGVDDYIVKPFDARTLARKIAPLLAREPSLA